MRRARLLIALIVAVLWLPATMHCAFEVLLGYEFLSCCSHEEAGPHQDNDCQADACAAVESGFYKLQDYEDLVAPAVDIDIHNVFDHLQKSLDVVVVEATPPPLDLAAGWQFSSRAAPLPRAPSVLL